MRPYRGTSSRQTTKPKWGAAALSSMKRPPHETILWAKITQTQHETFRVLDGNQPVWAQKWAVFFIRGRPFLVPNTPFFVRNPLLLVPIGLHFDDVPPGCGCFSARHEAPNHRKPGRTLRNRPVSIREVDDQIGTMLPQKTTLKRRTQVGTASSGHSFQSFAVHIGFVDLAIALDDNNRKAAGQAT